MSGLKPAARQSTLESCRGVLVLPSSTLNFGAEELNRLRDELTCTDSPVESLLESLRTLSCLIISTDDLKTSMVGRAVSRLQHHADVDVAQLAARLVTKWREEVARASGGNSGGAGGARASGGSGGSYAAAAAAGGRNISAWPSGWAGAAAALPPGLQRSHAAVQEVESSSELLALLQLDGHSPAAHSLSRALGAALARAPRSQTTGLSAALASNGSLRAALLMGWLAPESAVTLDARTLLATDFLS